MKTVTLVEIQRHRFIYDGTDKGLLKVGVGKVTEDDAFLRDAPPFFEDTPQYFASAGDQLDMYNKFGGQFLLDF